MKGDGVESHASPGLVPPGDPLPFFASLCEHVSSGIAIYKPVEAGDDFVFLGINAAAERIDRVTRSEVVGRRVAEVFPGVVEFGLLEVLARVSRTGVPERHPVREYRDGRISGWRENHVFRLPGGEVVAVYEDRTTEMELETRFRQVAERIREVFWLSTPDFRRVLYLNPAFEALWGRSFRDLERSRTSLADTMHPADRAKVRRDLVSKLRGGFGDSPVPEFRILRPDGETRWISARAFPVRDSAGVIVQIAGIAEDVTERRRVEEVARRLEGRFRATFEQAAVGMAHIGRDGRFLRINRKLCEITGYSAADLSARTFQDITHPDDLDSDVSLAQRLWAGDIDTYRIEKRYIRPDGSAVWVNLTASVARDEEGHPDYGIAVLEDISLRKAAESLLANEQLLRMSLTAAHAGAWEHDFATGRSVWSPQTHAIFGTDPSRPPPMFEDWLSTCVHPEDHHLFRDLVAREFAGDVSIDFRSPGPDGSIRWLSTSGRITSDGDCRPLRAFGVVTDITARRRTEEALRESEARLRLATEAGGIGVWEWDLASGRVVWSEALARRLGMPSTGVAEAVEALTAVVHPEDRAAIASGLSRTLRGEGEFRAECRVVPPGGKPFWVEFRAELVRDGAGRAQRMIGVEMDITPRKEAEARQALIAAELRHRVKNLLATVQATMRHTIRHSGSLEQFDEAFSGRLDAIGRGVDLLLESGWRTVEISRVIGRTLESFGPRHRVMVHGPDVPLSAMKAQTLTLVLHELATNATKYGALSTPDGLVEVDCSVSGADPVLLIRWTERGGPPAKSPRRQGFGSKLINQSVRHALDGKVAFRYGPDGLEAEFRIPLAQDHMSAGGGD